MSNFTWKKAVVLMMTAVMCISAAGCGKKKETETGKITATTHVHKDGKVSSDKPFQGTKNDTGYSYRLHENGFAHLAVPYPAGWKVEDISCRQTKITNEKTSTTIFIDHIPMMSGEAYKDASTTELMNMFSPVLSYETFQMKGDTYKRYVSQDISQPASAFEENNAKKTVFAIDIKDLAGALEPDEEAQDHVGAERRYYIKYDNVATCISVITSQKNYKKMCKVADYIASNVQPYKEGTSGTKTISVAKGVKLKLPRAFSQTDSASMEKGSSGTIFQCPGEKRSAYAGMFVAIADTNRELNKDTADPTALFTQVYPDLIDEDKNEYVTLDEEDTEDGQGQIYLNAKIAAWKHGTQITPEYVGAYSATGVSSQDANGKFYYNGMSWSFEIFQIGSGSDARTVFIVYPSASAEDAEKAFSFH